MRSDDDFTRYRMRKRERLDRVSECHCWMWDFDGRAVAAAPDLELVRVVLRGDPDQDESFVVERQRVLAFGTFVYRLKDSDTWRAIEECSCGVRADDPPYYELHPMVYGDETVDHHTEPSKAEDPDQVVGVYSTGASIDPDLIAWAVRCVRQQLEQALPAL